MSKPPVSHPLAQKKDPTLSLCMIVKNEAQTLEKCLSFARPHVDEIVIVDTGSTDGTRAIAQRYADVFDEIPWPGSFSEARNHSLDLASSTFILILDGDEYLSDPLGWQRIREALQPDLAGAQIPVFSLLEGGGLVQSDRLWLERLFRNQPDVRFTGRVHNQIGGAILAHAKRMGKRVTRVQAEVIHTGYALSPERLKEKYTPRLPLLIWEYENAQTSTLRAYYGYQLAVGYIALDQLEEAASVFNALDYSRLNGDNAFHAHVLAAQAAVRLHRGPIALLHSDRALKISRTEPLAYYATGLSLMLTGQPRDGLLMLLEAVHLSEAGRASIRFVMDTRELLHKLAFIFESAGMQAYAKALEHLLKPEAYDAKAIRAFVNALKGRLVQSERAAQLS